MKPQTMFCLIGEQPVSNFLPVRFLEPQKVVLLCSDFTRRRAQFLALLLKDPEIVELVIEPYRLDIIIEQLEKAIREEAAGGNGSSVFNLTGGTKPMSLAAYHLCLKGGIPHCYLQSEGGRSLLHTYNLQEEQWLRDSREIDSIISIDEYLKLYIGGYHSQVLVNTFEDEVYKVLKGSVHEIARNISLGPALEVDLIFRVDNQIGIAEVKTGRTAQSKVGIDQLNTAAGREYLGTYIKKFLIINCAYPENNSLLAQERNIHVVELTGSGDDAIVPEDQEKLKKAVLQQM